MLDSVKGINAYRVCIQELITCVRFSEGHQFPSFLYSGVNYVS